MVSQEPPTSTRTSPPRYKLGLQAPLDNLEPLQEVLQHLSALCRANI
jgi:hypothetical protein